LLKRSFEGILADMTIEIILGIVISVTILAGYAVSMLWPEPKDYETKKPWLPPRDLTEEDRDWVRRHLGMSKEVE
jgi:hypothetical protein